MNTIFTKSENGKTSDPQRLLINLSDKIDLKRTDKYIVLSNLLSDQMLYLLYMEKYKISHTKTINSRH